MDKKIDTLSQLIIEADALLLLLHRHKEETPTDAVVMLRKKLQLILSLIDGIEDTTEIEERQYVHSKDETHAKEEPVTSNNSDIFIPEVPDFFDKEISQQEVGDYIENMVESPSPGGDKKENVITEPTKPSAPEVEFAAVEQTDEVQATPTIQPSLSIDNPESVKTPSSPVKQTPRRPVTSVFNLNDKFRFRR